jgi:hypothetical protein
MTRAGDLSLNRLSAVRRLRQPGGGGVSRGRDTATPSARRWPVALVVLVLTVAALFLRLQELKGPDGGLGTDESRLALAAQGVLATGVPTVPSGRIYTRAMLNAYLMAPSLWALGPHDFAARLPSAVIGALLIPLVFVFGRAAAGTPAGICAAVFSVLQPDLIKWSGKAWMPSLFVLAFVGAAYLLYLGYGRDRPSMQVAGACGFVAALLVHEFAIMLPLAVLATLAVRAARKDVAWWHGRRTALALAVVGFGLLLFVALGLFLRMGTIAGSTAEFSTYLSPSLTMANLGFYYERLLQGYPLLLVAAAIGLPLLIRSFKPDVLFLYMTIAVGFVTLGFLLYKSMERYGIMFLPLLAIVASWSVVEGVRLAGRRWTFGPGVAAALPPVVLGAVFGLSLLGDLRAALNEEAPHTGTWLAEFRAMAPAANDLVLADNPTVVAFYTGRVDYWARVQNYERYSYRAGDVIRELYTGAVRIGSAADFQRLVVDAHPGRAVWYLGSVRRFLDPYNAVEPALRLRLVEAAAASRITQDGWVILRIDPQS